MKSLGYNKNIFTKNEVTVKIDTSTQVSAVQAAPCCNGVTCFPCPMPYPYSYYPMPMAMPEVPIFMPAQAVYEPVIHDHPPIHEIRKLLNKKGKKKKKHATEEDSCDEDDK